MCAINLAKAKETAEADLGFEIDDETAGKVLKYAALKCVALGKGSDYLETLYENELRDHFTRMAINSILGGLANV